MDLKQRQASIEAEIRKQLGTVQRRSFRIEKRAIDMEARTVELAFASETPVERGWFFRYDEILKCSPEAVDTSRLLSGGPLLCEHDPECQIGVVESVRIEDGVCRATVRFSKNPKAEEEFQDIIDGIRQNVSVGYMIKSEVLFSRTDEKDTYLVDHWIAYEISIVSMAADITVGVGRSADLLPVEGDPAALAAQRAILPQNPTPPPAAPAQAPAVITVTERKQPMEPDIQTENARGIDEIAGYYPEDKWIQERARDAKTALRDVDDFRKEVIAYRDGKIKPIKIGEPVVELTEEETKRYSLARAILQSADPHKDFDGFEREISDEIAKRTGLTPQGFFIPTNLTRKISDDPNFSVRALDSGTSTDGAELKFTMAGDFIEMLRNKALVAQAGATFLPGLKGKVAMPRQTGAITAYWMGEEPGSNVTESEPTFDQVFLDAKTLMTTTAFTKQLLAIGSFDVENIIMNDLARVHALAIDLAALAGTGSSNQPTGVLYTSGVNLVALGTDGAVPSYANVVDLEASIEDSNGDVGPQTLITTPKIKKLLKLTQEFSGTNGVPVWGRDNNVNGYPALSTKQVPGNLTKGTSSGVCHALIQGAFQELMIGMWGALDLLVDPYSLKKKGIIEVTTFELADVATRYPKAFAVIKDALLS